MISKKVSVNKILLFALIVVIVLLRGVHSYVNRMDTITIRPHPHIEESITFARHLEDIRQRAEIWESPEPDTAPAEHKLQLGRLVEFAYNLNAGGIEKSDLRIVAAGCILNQRWNNENFQVRFQHEEDYSNAQLIAEMLDFTGICEDDILIYASTSWNTVNATPGQHEFMMSNQAAYEFLAPYLRLREFTMHVNSGTTYRDEIVITFINDSYQWLPIGWERSYYDLPRYSIYLSPNAYSDEIKSEILDLTGINRDDVRFYAQEPMHLHSDYLLVNEEWMQLRQYNERLRRFEELADVRSVRQNIVMGRVVERAGISISRLQDDYLPDFSVILRESMYYNENLRETLLAFTGIAEDNVHFMSMASNFFPTPYIRANYILTPSQQIEFEALEAFKEEVNAPFWYNRYLHDPVIIRIDLSGRWRSNHHSRFILRNYVIVLYEPDLAGLTNTQIARHTRGLRDEITAATGVSNIRFSAYTPLLCGFSI